MSILGTVVRVRPEDRATVTARLGGLPGTDLALDPGDGRLVVLIEDTAAGPDGVEPPSAAAVLARIATWPEVLGASLVYEYSGPDAPAPADAAGSDYRAWRSSLDTLAQGVPTAPEGPATPNLNQFKDNSTSSRQHH